MLKFKGESEKSKAGMCEGGRLGSVVPFRARELLEVPDPAQSGRTIVPANERGSLVSIDLPFVSSGVCNRRNSFFAPPSKKARKARIA